MTYHVKRNSSSGLVLNVFPEGVAPSPGFAALGEDVRQYAGNPPSNLIPYRSTITPNGVIAALPEDSPNTQTGRLSERKNRIHLASQRGYAANKAHWPSISSAANPEQAGLGVNRWIWHWAALLDRIVAQNLRQANGAVVTLSILD